MNNLKKRLDRLSPKVDDLPDLDITYVSCKEHVDHPERFDKVLEKSEPIQGTKAKFNTYSLKRKNHESE